MNDDATKLPLASGSITALRMPMRSKSASRGKRKWAAWSPSKL